MIERQDPLRFVSAPQKPTISELLRQLGYQPDAGQQLFEDKHVKDALMELLLRTRR